MFCTMILPSTGGRSVERGAHTAVRKLVTGREVMMFPILLAPCPSPPSPQLPPYSAFCFCLCPPPSPSPPRIRMRIPQGCDLSRARRCFVASPTLPLVFWYAFLLCLSCVYPPVSLPHPLPRYISISLSLSLYPSPGQEEKKGNVSRKVLLLLLLLPLPLLLLLLLRLLECLICVTAPVEEEESPPVEIRFGFDACYI